MLIVLPFVALEMTLPPAVTRMSDLPTGVKTGEVTVRVPLVAPKLDVFNDPIM